MHRASFQTMLLSACFLGLSVGPGMAQDTARQLDTLLLKAMGASKEALAARIQEEEATRAARRQAGDRLDAAREQEEKHQLELGDERGRQKVRNDVAEFQESLRREELERQRIEQRRREERQRIAAWANANRSASPDSFVRDAINRNAQSLLQADLQGQAALNSARWQADAINNLRTAEAEADAARKKAESVVEAARQASTQDQTAAAVKARKAAEEADAAKRRAAESGQSAATPNTLVAGVRSGGVSPELAFGVGSASAPVAPRPGSDVTLTARDPVTRKEALAYCFHEQGTSADVDDAVWICDGPVQKTLVTEPVAKALTYVGCDRGNLPGNSMGYRNTGYIYYCGYGIRPFDRDVSSLYPLSSPYLVRRKTYRCKDASSACDAASALGMGG